MNKIVIISMVMALALGVMPSKASQWYEDGNLHKSKLIDWNNSSHLNKLATSSDFIAKSVSQTRAYSLMANDGYLMKRKAEELVTCINNFVQPSLYSEKVSVAAAMCLLNMKL